MCTSSWVSVPFYSCLSGLLLSDAVIQQEYLMIPVVDEYPVCVFSVHICMLVHELNLC